MIDQEAYSGVICPRSTWRVLFRKKKRTGTKLKISKYDCQPKSKVCQTDLTAKTEHACSKPPMKPFARANSVLDDKRQNKRAITCARNACDGESAIQGRDFDTGSIDRAITNERMQQAKTIPCRKLRFDWDKEKDPVTDIKSGKTKSDGYAQIKNTSTAKPRSAVIDILVARLAKKFSKLRKTDPPIAKNKTRKYLRCRSPSASRPNSRPLLARRFAPTKAGGIVII